MDDDAQSKQQLVSTIIKNVMKRTGFLMTAAALAAVLYSLHEGHRDWWSVATGILFGAFLGALNFRWLALAVQRLLLKRVHRAGPSNPALVILNFFKLMAIFVALFIVIKWQLVNIFGLVIGLSLCFLAVIWEGLSTMAQACRE